jgi:hypothetical protein
MVSTRRSPENEPPAGVPTRWCKPLSRREQAVVRAERAERAVFPTFFFNLLLVKLLVQVPFMLIRPFYAYFYAK